MSKCILALVSFFYLFNSIVHSQTNINTNFFFQNNFNDIGLDDAAPHGGDAPDITWGFQGSADENNHNIAFSLRVGTVIFAFESLTSEGNKTSSEGFAYGGQLSAASSASFTGTSNRMLMGVLLPNNIAVYGFAGLTPYLSHSSLSYKSKREFQEYQSINGESGENSEKGGGRWASVHHITEGNSSLKYNHEATSLGIGMETLLFGGALRVEYSVSELPGYDQTVQLNSSSTSIYVPVANEQKSAEYEWAERVEQSLKLRWRTLF
ncbi:MAG: hypothetical protein AAF228_06305 [Pseudomonadota bacterium]